MKCYLYVVRSRVDVVCEDIGMLWSFPSSYGLGRDLRTRFGLWDEPAVEVDPNELIRFISAFYCRKGVATTITPMPILWWNAEDKKPQLLDGVHLLFTLIEATGYDVSRLCEKLKKLYDRYQKGEVIGYNLIDWVV